MKILFDFKCPEGHITERLVPREQKNDVCHCGEVSSRMISPVRCKLEGLSGHFPGASIKWERQHEKAGRQPSDTDPNGW